MIARDGVTEQTHPVFLQCAQDSATITVAVLGELQKKDTVMTAVDQVMDVTGDNVSIGTGHGTTLAIRSRIINSFLPQTMPHIPEIGASSLATS